MELTDFNVKKIPKEVVRDFKARCVKDDISMKDVITTLMEGYSKREEEVKHGPD